MPPTGGVGGWSVLPGAAASVALFAFSRSDRPEKFLPCRKLRTDQEGVGAYN